ncbi:MAG: hypothetical protein Tsb009_02980 [Planctomycetaceae bacterium]
MCGILGIVAEPGQSRQLTTGQILHMRDRMTMRGPDGCGIFEKDHIAFAHRRLAIRDLEAGQQPWISDDGQTVLVYNGELYNDEELRSKLRAHGHRFRTRCDTETVMAAFHQWGPDCVRQFRGMFALGVYDFRDNSLFLARDRVGIKPLFLMSQDHSLVFASSIAALTSHPQFQRRPCWPVVSHYLTTFRLTLGRMTMFEGIQQLLPGERLHWKEGRIRVDRYWEYPDESERVPDYTSAVQSFSEELKQSVEMRLVSDVPVGMFLSGGVDSNTLACLVHELRPNERMFGYCGGGEHYAPHTLQDDFFFARKCAKHVQFHFREVRVSANEYRDCWNWMLDEYTTPLSTPTDVILYRLSQETKKNVGVVLGGEGADELLCGYAVPHFAWHDYDRLRELEQQPGGVIDVDAQAFRESLKRQYGRDCFASLADHYLALNSLIPLAAKSHLFQPWLWEVLKQDRELLDFYSEQLDLPDWNHHTGGNSAEPSAARREMRVLHRVNLEGLLGRLDSATMLAGLEARVPYTDHNLIEQVFQLPQRYRIDVAHDVPAPRFASQELEQRGWLHSKRMLRGVAQQLMPSELALRKKASFPTPVEHWLTDDWSEEIQNRLKNSEFAHALFRPAAIAEICQNLGSTGLKLWPVMNVVEWGERQFC